MLLPDRHPVRDFFVIDAVEVAPRSDMASMEHPFYSLSTKPDRRVLTYTNGNAELRIAPSHDGLPTIFDKDVLIYCVSHLMAAKGRGEAISPVLRLTTYDLLVSTNRPTARVGYERLEGALRRLRGCTFETNVRTGDEVTVKGFGLIDSYSYRRKGSMWGDERLRYLEVTLSDWLFRAVESAEVLPIHRNYFRLRRPLDRRFYELARKHCGARQELWRIGIDKLQMKTGSKSEPKEFMRHMREVARTNHLPDYSVALEGTASGVQVVFRRRGPMLKSTGKAHLTVDSLDYLIGEAAMAEARAIAREKNLDFYHVRSAFVAMVNASDEPLRLPDGAFLGFLKKKRSLRG